MKFYGFANGTFYVSVNGGANFTAAATGLPPDSKFKAVPGREGDIWLAGGEGGLWRSTNSGASFTEVTSVEEADTIGFGMAAPGQSYMALYSSAQVNGVRGIFRSTDAGASWVRINDDQHQYGSTNAAITGDPRVFGRVYISTNGRGIIYGEPSGVSNPDFSLSAKSFKPDDQSRRERNERDHDHAKRRLHGRRGLERERIAERRDREL